MLNFDKLVDTLLLEVTWDDTAVATDITPTAVPTPVTTEPAEANTYVDYPDWFVKILKQHEKLNFGHIKNKDIKNIFNIATKSYISIQDARNVGKNIRLLDVIRVIYNDLKIKPKSQSSFFASSEANSLGIKKAQEIGNYNKNNWNLESSEVENAYKHTGGERINFATTALQSVAGFAGAKLYT